MQTWNSQASRLKLRILSTIVQIERQQLRLYPTLDLAVKVPTVSSVHVKACKGLVLTLVYGEAMDALNQVYLEP